MSRADLLKLSLKGLLAWLVLSASGLYFGERIGALLLPLFEIVIRVAAPEYAPSLTLVAENHDFLIRLNAWVLHPFPLGGGQSVPSGKELTAGTHLLHTLVPVVIQLSILLVWPVRQRGARAILLAFGIATSLLVVGATGPFVLVGTLEVLLQEMAEEAHVVRPEPWILTWMIFTEMGGRWVLPIVAALLCIRAHSALFAKPTIAAKNSTFFD